MARKTTKRKATKPVARKKVAKRSDPKARLVKSAKPAKKKAPARASVTVVKVPDATTSPRGLGLLRAWSPARYSHR